MDMIQTEKLVFEYEKRDEEGNVIGTSRAIDEVDIDVEEGQFIAILGHNGSGKSTFAKHINAILVPTEGTMWVDGKDTKDPDISERPPLQNRSSGPPPAPRTEASSSPSCRTSDCVP